MPHKKILLIANPNAGNKCLKRKWESDIHPFLKSKLKKFDVAFTKKAGDATTIAREANQNDYNIVVAMGGDGTINEVANGFLENSKPINPNCTLGILPFGSGGDFIRTLKIDRDYQKATHALITKKTKKIDVGYIEYKNKTTSPRYFINIAEIGLGANIMQRVNAKNKNLPALLRYLTGTLQGFADYNNIKVRLHLKDQGHFEVNLTNLVIANGQYFGRGMRPAPQAKLDDGLFDVIVMKDVNLVNFLINFPQIYASKKHMTSKILDNYQASQIEIEVLNPKDDLLTELDGENHGGGNQKVSLLHKVITLQI
ncbi:hypothetical protein BVY03_01975 [bacterium K02(2017)]|nr:hypothetical protein BVY03_01975 [bacterium K02(2017)]